MADKLGLVVRVAANVDALRANLAEGKDQIETTTAAMANMVTRFQGDKLIQTAHNIAAAINDIGGVSRLTAAEQERVSATIDKALEKYQALGREAPQGLKQISEQLHQNTKETEDFGAVVKDTLTDFAKAFGLAFSIEKAVEFGKVLLEEAHALEVLSLQTQTSVEELQLLGAATKSYGIDSDQVGRAIFQLGQRIAGGDQSVVTGLALLGLTIDDVRDKKGADLFLTIERALGQLHGTLRDTAAADLYGGRLGASLGAFSTNVDDAMDRAKRLNVIMSEDTVKAVAEMEQSITRAQSNIKALATQLIAGPAESFNIFSEALMKGQHGWDLFKAFLQDAIASGTLSGLTMSHLNAALAETIDVTDRAATSKGKDIELTNAVTEAANRQAKVETFLATLKANAAQTLTAAQIAELEQLKAIGQLNEHNAAAIGINQVLFTKYKEGLEEAKKAAEELTKAQAAADAQAMNTYQTRIRLLNEETQASLKNYSFGAQIAALDQLDAAERDLTASVYAQITSEKDRAKLIDENTKHHLELMRQEMTVQREHLGVVNAAILAEFNAQTQLNQAMGLDASGAIAVQDTAYGRLTKALDALHLKKVEGISQAAQEHVLMDAFTKSLYDEAVAADKAAAANADVTDSLKDENTQAEECAKGFDAFVGTVIQGTQQLSTFVPASIDEINNELMKMSNIGAPSGVGAGLLYSGPTQRRAAGGPVTASTPYLVGERGPELFVPERAGTIIPHAASGGNVSISIPITINGSVLSDETKIARAVGDAMVTRLRSLGVPLPARA